MKKFMIGILVVLNVLLGIAVIKEAPNHAKSIAIQQQYDATMAQVNQLEKDSKDMNTTQVKKAIKKQDINLDQDKADLSNKISQGLDMAYSHTHNDQDYTNLKKTLPNLVGKALSSKILESDMAMMSQNGKLYPYVKLVDHQIAFGNYDLTTHQMPVVITIHYLSNLGNGKTSDAYGYYTATYNAKTKQLSDVNYTAMKSAPQQTGVNN